MAWVSQACARRGEISTNIDSYSHEYGLDVAIIKRATVTGPYVGLAVARTLKGVTLGANSRGYGEVLVT